MSEEDKPHMTRLWQEEVDRRLAAALLRDVPRINGDRHFLVSDVLAALSRALDGVDERAGEVVKRLTDEHVAASRTEAADLITALIAQNAALRAERDEPHWDDHCVNQFAKMMREKMALSRAKGRSGWNDPNQCSVEYLRNLLYEHLDKGDPVDVANFCMMLRHYDASTRRDYGNTLDMWKARAEAAEAEVEKLRGAGSNLVAQLYQMWTEARDHRDRGDLGSAEYAKRDMVASAFRDAYLAALSATTEEGHE